MNLLYYLYIPQILAREKTIIEKIKIQQIENMTLILVDKEKIQKLAYTITL